MLSADIFITDFACKSLSTERTTARSYGRDMERERERETTSAA